jgi:hypothetical protein
MSSSRLHSSSLEVHEIDAGLPFMLHTSASGEYSVRQQIKDLPFAVLPAHCEDELSGAGCIPVFVGPPFHAMPFARHVDYAASSVFINLTDTRKWFGKEKAQWHLNPRIQNKHKGKEGDSSIV